MPSPEDLGTRWFDVAWTTYRVSGPSTITTITDQLAPSTPPFRAPTHTVTYSITTADGSGYRLIEQGDDLGGSGDESWLAKTLRRRVWARLHQIAGLAGWAPLQGAMVDAGPHRVLLLTDPGHGEILEGTAVPDEVDMFGRGTCLIRPEATAVVGTAPHRSDPSNEIAPSRPPTDVIILDPGEETKVAPATTPQVIGRILDSVIDSSSLPPAISATAVRALTPARAWRVTISDPATTLGMIITHLG